VVHPDLSAMFSGNGEFARFLNYAYRSLKEVVTCLELCQRLHPSLSAQSVTALINEGTKSRA
jgi:four helix bundle protein